MLNQELKQDELGSSNILIIEDNPETVELATMNLEMEGYKVSSSSNGDKGLKQAEMMPDVILLDVMMPGMDGLEVCKKLKANPRTRDILVIMLTAKISTEDVLEGFKAGADEYITKPFHMEELLARVRSMVRIKRGRDKLKDLNAILEDKVIEKTALLEEAGKKLATLEKAKGDFLTLLAHELRTPLNSIIGFSEILIQDLDSEDQIDSCRMIQESGYRLLHLSKTAELLTALRMEKYDFAMQTISMKGLLEDITWLAYQKAEEKQIHMIKDISFDDFNMRVDLALLKRCLSDVLDNAIKFAPERGTVKLRASLNNGIVLIEILDNGPGFSEDALAHVFDLFCSGDISHHKEGFGLSLAAAKIIMEVHKGKIEAENRPEGGAVVRLTLKVK